MTKINRTALLSLEITPNTREDQERLGQGLGALMAEDATLTVTTMSATGVVVIGATGETHLEIIVDRLKREFQVEAAVGRPKIVYRETLTRAADGEVKYATQADGRGQYAHVKIHLHPGEPGSGYAFENEIIDGVIPPQFIGSVDDGVRDALTRGVVGGYAVDDVRVVLYDGSYHDVDSSAAAFRMAGWMAFMDAVTKANPMLLEPIMHVEVILPEEHTADILRNLADRRAHILSQDHRDGTQVVNAHVPLAEMFGYRSYLSSQTRGRGTFTMRLAAYRPVDPAENDEAEASGVRVPRPLAPTLPDWRIELPEPTDDIGE